MKTSELEALGLSKDQIDAVFAMHGKEVNAAKAAAEETHKAEEADVAALQVKIERLEADKTDLANAHAAELLALKKGAAVDAALTAAKARNLTAAKAVLEEFLGSAEMAADGSVKGLTEKLTELTTGEATAFLFDTAPAGVVKLYGATPANTPKPPPGAAADPASQSYEDFLAQNYA